jgi:hypothetical protein
MQTTIDCACQLTERELELTVLGYITWIEIFPFLLLRLVILRLDIVLDILRSLLRRRVKPWVVHVVLGVKAIDSELEKESSGCISQKKRVVVGECVRGTCM